MPRAHLASLLLGFATALASAQRATVYAQAPGSPIATGPLPGRPVLADMDRDGHLDIVLACGTCCGSPADPASGKVVWLRNDGRGRFAVADSVTVGPSVRKVAVGDLDGDGLPDVVAAEHDSYAV